MYIFFIFVLFSTLLNSSTLKLSISSNPSRINPILSTDSASREISQWIFNGLFKYDKNGNIICDLAKSYYFKTTTKLIVRLKKYVKWHDNHHLTADDVIFTYKTINSSTIFTPLKSDFKMIKNIRKLDNFTIEINYKKPYFKALEIWMVGLLPKHLLKNEKDLMTSSFNKHPIGTGSYQLKQLTISSDIILKANDDYFDGRPKIDTITYKFMPDTTTSFYNLKQKQLDIGGLTPIQIDRQIDDKFKQDFKICEKSSFGYTYMGFNLKRDKFKDIKIRQALNLGINRQELVDILFFGHGKICTGPFLPNTFAFNKNIQAPKQNIKQAKQLLKQMGYDNNNPFEFEVITNVNNSIRVNAAQILQYQLSFIGVNMKIRVMEWQAFLNTIITPRNFDAIILGWRLSLMPDAKPLWHSSSDKKGGFNLVGYVNKDVDSLIEQGESTIDKKELGKIYKQIFTKISDDLPYLFLYIPNSITAINNNIQNVSSSIVGITHNQKDWIKK
ncbi:Oligopeptide ABC transporter, periplasmic oligopeptide-binding protein OppA (TC 3.A.1.5.1) [hydrothermal vent metagenome]|uniref:Oligopeptide ABC transporter, periplasmic oligopeptide-binding protein OppA (TC 3.A.1.5.1) n=1 Tax=hydrothermal vent metagenome TaxID=652676 RepID=A0A3B1EAC4_9ZZZZ